MDLFADLSDRLLFAVPKKGRLHERCLQLLEGADVQFRRNHRHDIALVHNLPVALVFLPAADIAKFVGEGNVHLGITGRDIVEETEQSDKVEQALALGFGKCKLSVQAPARGPQAVHQVEDLVGKRVVTSFTQLSSKYFAELDQRPTEIKYVGGSVEAACALGLADCIVDLVESGETMRAAGLHAIANVLNTEAILIRNPRVRDNSVAQKLIARIEGVITAQRYVLCNYNCLRSRLPAASKITPGRTAPTISTLEDDNHVAVSSMVLKSEVANIMDRLKEIGATDILVFNINNCRV
ncbi:ATP phosphoribosyltransferase [Thamnocephalis sphaerospora]|uniref:ATP phosphoribosyltransferase n=1 Tax=Thamnocephalis sphaerospora TaxID=78915 RepID=A0A4P9XM86_9FUNG|nr:ATP phosphoribosyltransferase [Thamnocephalis sphaerospora]|eukprot:RKP07008.1 ATP phosphoribosyltransferase [Thamnocephalis sphaerospora]